MFKSIALVEMRVLKYSEDLDYNLFKAFSL